MSEKHYCKECAYFGTIRGLKGNCIFKDITRMGRNLACDDFEKKGESA